jgi:hypothetical protein
MEAPTRVIPFLHHYPVSTEPEEMGEQGNVMLGFDAEERLIQKLPQDFAANGRLGLALPASRARTAGAQWLRANPSYPLSAMPAQIAR